MANAGTGSTAGRFSWRPSAFTTSAWVSGCGPVRFTGPVTVGWSSRKTIARTWSCRVIHDQNWSPPPSGPASPSTASGMSLASAPLRRVSTIPVRRWATEAPAASAGKVAASQSWHRSARKPPPRSLVSVRTASPRSP
ncbi:hypothetical protein BJF81_06395 [Ornithinimicrobium sp. CNJ-824]|nr:hypothetical protein BJF81_06395 [Ornithinimicrobium sp. CNJ-824]